MREIHKGIIYVLDNFHEKDGEQVDSLHFVHREPNEDLSLETKFNGTTLTEVLSASLECLRYLNEQLPCEENIWAIDNIRRALRALEMRREDRREREVLGTHKP